MGTAVRPAKASPVPWDAFVDVDVFEDEVLVELSAMAKGGAVLGGLPAAMPLH